MPDDLERGETSSEHDESDEVSEVWTVSSRLTMICTEYISPTICLSTLFACDVYMIYKVFQQGVESTNKDQLSLLIAINVAFMLYATVAIVYRCDISRRKYSCKITDDDAPSCSKLNGRLVSSSLPRKRTCPVCLEEISETFVYITQCNHRFHPQCIQDCVENEIVRCPMCRETMTTTQQGNVIE